MQQSVASSEAIRLAEAELFAVLSDEALEAAAAANTASPTSGACTQSYPCKQI